MQHCHGPLAGILLSCIWVLAGMNTEPVQASEPRRASEAQSSAYALAEGEVTVSWDIARLATLGVNLYSDQTDAAGRATVSYPLSELSGGFMAGKGRQMRLSGAGTMTGNLLLADPAHESLLTIGDFRLVLEGKRAWAFDTLEFGRDVFSVALSTAREGNTLTLDGPIMLGPSLADWVGQPEFADEPVGAIVVSLTLEPGRVSPQPVPESSDGIEDHPYAPVVSSEFGEPGGPFPTPGFDVIVGDLNGIERWGAVDGIAAYSIGTTSCNKGTEVLPWIQSGPLHPVIPQNMYRLRDGRFEQIGMSWLKHGFCALQQNICEFGCEPAGLGCPQALGVGCSDPYTANLNGSGFATLGPRSEVNPWTGDYVWPPSFPDSTHPTLRRRIQVDLDDLNPAMNEGALYFGEAMYVHRSDAQDGHHNNNASHRRFEVLGPSAGTYILGWGDSTTVREYPAIYAWQAHQPGVEIEIVDVPNEGRFFVGHAATENDDGTWHYEYAIFNLNSDRAARLFSVPSPAANRISNVRFHGIDHHSGEPYDTFDWAGAALEDEVLWFINTYEQRPNANALRWGSLFNFRFDSTAPPQLTAATLGLFKPGTPMSLTVSVVGPQLDCVLDSDCDDGLACTVNLCVDELCEFQPVDCSDLDTECSAGICNPDSGACESEPAPYGTPCNDGFFCTERDYCDGAGFCTGELRDCSEQNKQCQIGVCDEENERCIGVPGFDLQPCDDENPCTERDACRGGDCLGVPVECPNDNCMRGYCERESGTCKLTPGFEGRPCDDGDHCTYNEFCREGTCEGVKRDCAQLTDSCNVGTCNDETGACVADPRPNGTACDDGDACTGGDYCHKGICRPGAEDLCPP